MKDKRHVPELALPLCVLIHCLRLMGGVPFMWGQSQLGAPLNQLAVSLVVADQRPECLGLTCRLPAGEVVGKVRLTDNWTRPALAVQPPSSFNVRSMNQRHAIIRTPNPAYMRTSITAAALQPAVMFPHASDHK